MERTRVDKWVWAIRLFKTRSDATDACRGGHVKINDVTAKPAANVVVGDRVRARVHGVDRDVEVVELIEKRVGAPIAARCYIDHTIWPEKQSGVPGLDFPLAGERDRGAGRPTKRDRREIDRWRDRGS